MVLMKTGFLGVENNENLYVICFQIAGEVYEMNCVYKFDFVFFSYLNTNLK